MNVVDRLIGWASPRQRNREKEEAAVKALIANSGLFDVAYYLGTYGDVGRAGADPIEHYLSFGAKEGRNPSEHFSTTRYLRDHPEVAESDINPLVHHILSQQGHETATKPRPAIDSSIPPATSESDFDRRVNRIRRSEYFDASFYLSVYPDIKAAGIDPVIHYLTAGYSEGRDPSRYFSTKYYLAANPDVANADVNPLEHFLISGQAEGRRASARFIDRFRLPFDVRSLDSPLRLPVVEAQPGAARAPELGQDKIGVHVHCYFEERMPELARSIALIEGDVRLFVSVASEGAIGRVEQMLAAHGLIAERFAVVPNRGRDLAPMLVEFGKELLGCDIALHVHTKKSVEREAYRAQFGDQWNASLARNLLFNPAYITSIQQLFRNRPKLGVVCPEPFSEIRPFMTWGGNLRIAKMLMRRLGHSDEDVGENEPYFPAGSMCWFRPDALRGLFELGLRYDDFPPEPIPDDGTLAHAIERCFLTIATKAGFEHVTVAPLPYEKSWPKDLPPNVTVVIPVYNALPWLDMAVQSVLAQEAAHVPTEILLVDNGSTDGSVEVAQDYAARHANIRALHEPRRGAGAARNRGLLEARGRYIAFLDADDVLTSDALGSLFAVIESDDTVDFVTSSLVMYDEQSYGQVVPFDGCADSISLDKFYIDSNLPYWDRVFSDFGPCAKLYRRSFLDEHQIQFPDGNFEDNEFIYDVYMATSKLGLLSRPTYFYRRYEARHGATQSTQNDRRALRDQLAVISRIVEKHKIDEPSFGSDLAARNLAKKIGWELARFKKAPWALEVLREFDTLLALVDHHDLWSYLDVKPSEVIRLTGPEPPESAR